MNPVQPARALGAALAIPVLLAAACGSQAELWPAIVEVGQAPVVPRLVSNELVVGPNQFVFGLLDDDNATITKALVDVRFHDLEGGSAPSPAVRAEAVVTPGADPAYRWLYVVPARFPRAGAWGAAFAVRLPDGDRATTRLRFPVYADSPTLAIGERAPPTANLTLADVNGDLRDRQLTTDADPDPAFYAATVAAAREADRPFVVAFATPGFCETRTCGPLLDVLKRVRSDYAPAVTFIHVEVADVEASERQGALIYKPLMAEWGLETEPWAFVFDTNGRLIAKYEGVLLEAELRRVLTAILREDEPL